MTIAHEEFQTTLQAYYRKLHETHGEAIAFECLTELFAPFGKGRPAPDPHGRPIHELVEVSAKVMNNNTADTWSGNAAQAGWVSVCSDLRTLALDQTAPAPRGTLDWLSVVYALIADLPRKMLAVSWGLLAEAAPVIMRRALHPVEVHPLIAFRVSVWNVPTRNMCELYCKLQRAALRPRHGQSSSVFDGWYAAAGPIIRMGDLVATLADWLTEITLRYAPEANPGAELFNVLFQGEWKATKAALR